MIPTIVTPWFIAKVLGNILITVLLIPFATVYIAEFALVWMFLCLISYFSAEEIE